MATPVVAPPIIQPTPIIEKAPISRVIQPASKGITTPIVDTIESKLIGKPGNIKAQIKSQEISKYDMSGFYVRNGLTVQIVGAITPINISGQNGIQLYAKAWRNGKQLGFGKDGTIEIERFRIFNPPILVDDPNGTIIREGFDIRTGKITQRRLREDPAEATKQTLAHTILVSGKINTNIIIGSVGNTTSTFYPAAGANSPVDGGAWYTGATYSTVHDAADGTSASATNAFIYLYGYLYLGNYTLGRAATLFNTAAISPDVVSSATLSFYGLADKDDGDTQTVNIVASTPASNADITTADYDQFGTTLLSGTTIRLNVFGTSYNDFPLNATGVAAISTSGITKLGARLNLDISNTAPTANGYVSFSAADEAGTTQDPKLVVVHAAAATPIEPLTDDDVYDE